MKRIPVSNHHFLHLYLIEEKQVDDDYLANVRDSISREAEADQSGDPSGLMPDYKQGAQDFIDGLKDRYCIAFIEELMAALAEHTIEYWDRYSRKRLEEAEYVALKRYLQIVTLEKRYGCTEHEVTKRAA